MFPIPSIELICCGVGQPSRQAGVFWMRVESGRKTTGLNVLNHGPVGAVSFHLESFGLAHYSTIEARSL